MYCGQKGFTLCFLLRAVTEMTDCGCSCPSCSTRIQGPMIQGVAGPTMMMGSVRTNKKRLKKHLIAQALVVLLGVFGTWFLLQRHLKLSIFKGANFESRGAVNGCPIAAAVDWSSFQDPGDTPGGVAAIYATSFKDSSLLWAINGLLSLNYEVRLLAQQGQQAAEAHTLVQLSGSNRVTVEQVQLHGYTLASSTVKVFVHVCSESMPQVLGKGHANVLVLRPPSTAGPSQLALEWQAQLLASYDYLLYPASDTFTRHSTTIQPVLEFLQQTNRMFPLLDVLPFPAPSVQEIPGQGLETLDNTAAGITFSMGKYNPSHRPLVQSALKAFKELHGLMPGQVKLILCAWLMPGLLHDLPHITSLIKELDLLQMYEVRLDNPDPEQLYHGIKVQWHLHNLDVKPHLQALQAMPAGVWVLDITGSLMRQPGLAYGVAKTVGELAQLSMQQLQLPHITQRREQQLVAKGAHEALEKCFNAKFNQVIHRSFRSKVIRFFMESSLQAYRSRISPATQRARAAAAQSKVSEHQYAAVIVEARPHYAFLYTVLNAAWYLPGWKLHVVHSRLNSQFVRRLLDPYLDVTYHLLDSDNVDIDDYNLLMKNATFWQMLEAEHVLLFQTDSLILKHGLEAFARFDYIGAPWHLENERWSQPEMKAALPQGVGNGGFSLRSTQAMVSISNEYGKHSPLKEQEDVYYARHIQAGDRFVLADRQSALQFCLEVPCRDMPFTRPHGLHASWFYNDLPTMQPLLDSSLFDLDEHECVK